MKIRTEEENIIVQKTLFENGYSWSFIGHHIIYDLFGNYFVFRKDNNNKSLYLYWTDIPTNNDPTVITFKEFINKYTIKGQRKEKLEKLSNI